MNKEALHWLIDKNKNNQKNFTLLNNNNYNDIIYYQKFNKKKNNSINKNTFEFLKEYTSQSLIKNQTFDQEIGNLISNISSEQEFHQFIGSINNNRYNEYIPKGWNPILKEIVKWFGSKIEISNKETIDWLIENSKSNKEYKVIVRKFESIKNPFSIFKFKSFELILYTYSKLNDSTDSVLHLNSNQDGCLFYNLFLNSIKTCNVGQLKCINENIYNNKLSPLLLNNVKSKDIKFINPNNENIILLVEYLNNEFQNNDNKSLYKNEPFFHTFVNMVVEVYKENNQILDLYKIKPNFNYFTNLTIKIFREALDTYNAPLIQLILDNNKSISLHMRFIRNDHFYSKEAYGQCAQLLTTSSSNASRIICTIEVLTNHYISIDHDSSFDQYRKSIENIINHLFLSLIKTNGLSTEILKSMHIKIIKSNINIDHSLVYSIYYLSIRSPKLVKYILEQPFLENNFYDKTYDYSFAGMPTGYKIEQYLDPQSLSFDYIFNCGVSFDELLFKLIHNLSHLPANNNELISKINDYFNVSLNSNLEYLLEIRREDLFFKELNFIQEQLKSNLVVGSFPQMAEYNNKGKNNKNQKLKKCCTLIESELNNDRVFHFSDRVYEISCNTMESNSFKNLAQFCCFQSLIFYLKSILNSEIKIFQHLLNQFDTINHIISQHSNMIDKEIQYFWFDIFKNVQSKLIISNYSIIKHQKILTTLFGNQDDEDQDDSNNNNFIENLTNGDIYNVEIYQLLLKLNIKQNNHPFLNISKSIIDESIKLEKINFLKYLYENGFIKDKDYLEKKLIMSKCQNVKWLK